MPAGHLPASLLDRTPGAGGVGGWPTLLVVDGDPEMLRTLVCYFEKRGFHAAAASSLAEACHLIDRRVAWSLVVCDYHLPDGTGWELCCWLRSRPGRPPPFLLTAAGATCGATCAEVEMLPRPFDLEQLAARVRALLTPSPT